LKELEPNHAAAFHITCYYFRHAEDH
jgi:hypothetical protein